MRWELTGYMLASENWPIRVGVWSNKVHWTEAKQLELEPKFRSSPAQEVALNKNKTISTKRMWDFTIKTDQHKYSIIYIYIYIHIIHICTHIYICWYQGFACCKNVWFSFRKRSEIAEGRQWQWPICNLHLHFLSNADFRVSLRQNSKIQWLKARHYRGKTWRKNLQLRPGILVISTYNILWSHLWNV